MKVILRILLKMRLMSNMVFLDGQYTKVSEVSGIEIELNLRNHVVYGFQVGVYKTNVDDIRGKIRKGQKFERVNLTQEGDNFYFTFLVDDKTGRIDGGHHRAYAHFLEGRVLPVRIIDGKYRAIFSKFRIRDWSLIPE